jgi:hypothetical protein
MIGNAGTIERVLQQIVGDQRIFGKIVTIESVDKEFNECDVSLVEDSMVKYFNVKLTPDSKSTFIAYPKIGSLAIMNFIDFDTCYLCQVSEIEGYYIGNQDNSFLDLMNDLFTAISNIQVQTNYGPSLPKSILNQSEFDVIQDKFKNLFLK